MLCPVACLRSARELDKVRQQLQEEVRQVGTQLLEERKKRETHEALARRLQKRVLLLTKVRAWGGRPAGVPSLQVSSAQTDPAACTPSPLSQGPHACQIATKLSALAQHTSWPSPLGQSESRRR